MSWEKMGRWEEVSLLVLIENGSAFSISTNHACKISYLIISCWIAKMIWVFIIGTMPTERVRGRGGGWCHTNPFWTMYYTWSGVPSLTYDWRFVRNYSMTFRSHQSMRYKNAKVIWGFMVTTISPLHLDFRSVRLGSHIKLTPDFSSPRRIDRSRCAYRNPPWSWGRDYGSRLGFGRALRVQRWGSSSNFSTFHRTVSPTLSLNVESCFFFLKIRRLGWQKVYSCSRDTVSWGIR